MTKRYEPFCNNVGAEPGARDFCIAALATHVEVSRATFMRHCRTSGRVPATGLFFRSQLPGIIGTVYGYEDEAGWVFLFRLDAASSEVNATFTRFGMAPPLE